MSSNTCTYILKKGKNKGQPCGIKCSNKEFCKKHSVDDDNNTDLEIKNDTQNTENNSLNKEKELKKSKEKEIKEKKQKEPNEKKEKELKKSKEPNEKKEKELKKSKEKETSIKVNVYERQKIQAKRNEHGNYVLENNLIVHPVNKNIIGRQDGNKLIEISIEDIEYCKENGFRYEQPSVMYFLDQEIEKKEIELQKQLLKSIKSKDNNEDKEDEDLENENDDIDEENDELENSEDEDL
jgi:hypothetical protein